MSNRLVDTEEYQTFRSSIPLRTLVVDDDVSKVWKLYDAGPKNILCPLVFLPPVSAGAEIFFKQVIFLSTLGYRVLALDYPVYWSVDEFCAGFCKVIHDMNLRKIHVFGSEMGGFLALKFVEHNWNKQFVASLFLCNVFTDSTGFKYGWASPTFWAMPPFLLKRFVLSSLSSERTDREQADAVDFVVDSLESFTQPQLASRLATCHNNDYVRILHRFQNFPVTVMITYDDRSLQSEVAKEDMYKNFPTAKHAHLKTGGRFPFLCRSSEVNLHLRIHLREFEGTRFSPLEGSAEQCEESQPSASVS